jgi:hypothetical protein
MNYKKVKIKKEENFIYIKMLIVTLVLIGLFLLIYVPKVIVNLNEREQEQININSLNQIIYACSTGDIFENAKCVNSYTSLFYKYNSSNLGEELSFSELKELGGVCEQWSNYFCSICDKLGYYTSLPSFKTTETKGYIINHQICVCSNNLGYVIFDAESIFEGHFNQTSVGEVENLIKNEK